MKRTYTLINEDTGEMINIDDIPNVQTKNKITKAMIDNMLSNAKNLMDIDTAMLYSWLKSTKILNSYNQIYLLGHYIKLEYLQLSNENPLLFGYTARLIEETHKFTNIIMKNRQTPVRTWEELYSLLNITSTNTRQKFKKFCEKHDLIRVEKRLRTKDKSRFTVRFILNPFLVRQGTYIGQIAISRYQDYIQAGCNVDSYAYRWMQVSGIIDVEEGEE